MSWSRFASGVVLAWWLGACGGAPGVQSDAMGTSAYTEGAATSEAANPPPAAPDCVQGSLRTCRVALPTQGDVHNCFSGQQLCTGGVWSDCQDPATLVGARSQQFSAACPATYGVRWTILDYVVDTPANASGAAAVTVSLADHPDVVLLDTSATDDAPANAGSLDLSSTLGSLSNQPTLTLAITTSTTPDGTLAATATVTPSYECIPN